MSSPVVILGGSGFIGTRLAGILLERGTEVRIGDLKRSEAFPELWRSCDIREPEALDSILRGAGAVINLAAEHRDDVHPVSRYQETNVDGSGNVCAAAVRAGISKIIFTSSVAVYGFHPQPVDESGTCAPFNPYGQTKLAAEGVYLAWAREDGSRALVIVRPTVVFGEGNRGNVYNLLHQIANDRFLMVGSGANVKSLAYVGNVAAFLAYALSFGAGTHLFNYVDGPDMDTRTLVMKMRESLNKGNSKLRRVPKSVALAGGHLLDGIGRITGRRFPISAIRVRKFCECTQFRADALRQSGFEAPYSLDDALTRTIRFEYPGSSAAAMGREGEGK